MTTDERQIRRLVDDWLAATAAGDQSRVLALMEEDVVFLQPGQPPLRGRKAFAAAGHGAAGGIRIEATSDIQEIEIRGDLAYCWNILDVTVTSLPDGRPIRRAGHVLTILRKTADGRWVVSRDANLLTTISDASVEEKKETE